MFHKIVSNKTLYKNFVMLVPADFDGISSPERSMRVVCRNKSHAWCNNIWPAAQQQNALSEFRNAFNWSTQKLGHLSVSPPVKMLHHEGPCRSLPLFQPICSNVAQCPIVGMSQLRLQYGQWVTDYWPYNNTKIIFTNHNTYSEVFFYK